MVGVINEFESTEFDLSSHFSAISLIFLTDGVTVPLPGDITILDGPLNAEEKDKSLGLSIALLMSIELGLSLFMANWAILLFVSPDCMAIIFPLLSIDEDHFFSNVDHFLFSSEICELVGVVTFDVTSFIALSFSFEAAYDLCDRLDLSDVILFVLEIVVDKFFERLLGSSFDVLSLESFLTSFDASTSLVGHVKLLVLSTLEDKFPLPLVAAVFFDDKFEREDLFIDNTLDSIDTDSEAAVLVDNEKVDETGASSRELLLDDTHEYDLMFAGFIILVVLERAPARES